MIKELNLIMATTTRKTTKVNEKGETEALATSETPAKAKTPTKATPEKLANILIAIADQRFEVTLENREQRISEKVAYAARERLGEELANLAGDDFNWEIWHKIFAKIFGEPTNLKYSPEMIAQTMAMIYHDIPTEPLAGIQALIDYSESSLQGGNKQEQEKRNNDLNDIEKLLNDEDLNFEDEDEFEDFDFDYLDNLK